jgi:hypothetical protein
MSREPSMPSWRGALSVPVGDRHAVYFVPLDPYLPAYDLAHGGDLDEVDGERWRVELHPRVGPNRWHFASTPLCLAWVYIYRFKDDDGPSHGTVEVRYIETPEGERRKGHATLLVRGLEARWGPVLFAGPYSEEGEPFIRSLDAAPEHRGTREG